MPRGVCPYARGMTHRFAALWVLLAGLLVGALFGMSFPPERVIDMMGEEGAVEQLTALGFFLIAPCVWLLRRGDDPRTTLAALSVVFLGFCARELDWHKVWTGTSVLRVSYYLGPAPLQHKLVALGVLAAFSLAVGWLLLRHGRAWWRGLRARDAVAISVAVFLFTIVLAKGLDRSYSILTEDLGLAIPMWGKAVVNALEECLELSLNAIALLALWQHRRRAPQIR